MAFDFAGYSDKRTFTRDWMFYVSIQLIIFIKVLIFFYLFGNGVSYSSQPLAINIPFAAVPVFGNLFHVWEYLFHQLMHVLIAFWALLMAKHVKKINVKQTIMLFGLATILHNVGYWLTYSHPSLAFSANDFMTDFAALWVFFLVFYFGFKLVPQSRKWKVPFF